MVSDTVQYVNQVVHNVGMAAWVGGNLFGRVAHNPSLRLVSLRSERGRHAAWNGFNAINGASLAAVGAGHAAGRLTELRGSNLSARETPLVRAMDVFTATGVFTEILTGIQGVRLAHQAPGGAVPVETGARPAPETPERARRIQRSINVLGAVNMLSGVGLVASTGLFWRSAASRPPLRVACSGAPAAEPGRLGTQRAAGACGAEELLDPQRAARAGVERRRRSAGSIIWRLLGAVEPNLVWLCDARAAAFAEVGTRSGTRFGELRRRGRAHQARRPRVPSTDTDAPAPSASASRSTANSPAPKITRDSPSTRAETRAFFDFPKCGFSRQSKRSDPQKCQSGPEAMPT